MFSRRYLIGAATVGLICLIGLVNCENSRITKVCDFEGCADLDEKDPRYSGPDYNRKLAKLISSGIAHLVYRDTSSLIKSSSLTEQCASQLATVSQAIEDGREWAFRFLDASGKTPAAFLEGTVTSLGDYDECLAIRGPSSDIFGQYCMVDVFAKAYKGHSNKFLNSGQVSLLTPQHFNESAYYFGLCFPSACSNSDVRTLVKKVLEPFPLLVEGDLHCDTLDSISWTTHLQNMRIGPFLSLVFLTVILSAVAWGSVGHALRGGGATEMQKNFSLSENVHKLFYVTSNDAGRTAFIDWYKAVGIFAGVTAHISLCIESLIGSFSLSHHRNFRSMLARPELSPVFNESGIVTLTFLSGAAFFIVAFPLAKQGRLPFKLALLDRVLRHLPGVATIIALDFTWYLWGSGPFWSRLGHVQVDKCSENWWKGLLFISNLWGESRNICGPHTFFSSVDIQLFILGFVAVALLAKSPKLGVAYCSILTLFSMALTYYYAAANELTPSLMVPRNPDPRKIEDFFKYVHMATSSYLPSYFVAILVSYSIYAKKWTMFATKINHFVWIPLIVVPLLLQQYSTILTNNLDWLGPEWSPTFIVSVRIACVVHNSFLIIYLSLFDAEKIIKPNANANEATQPNETLKKSDGGHYSASKALLRLSFAVYLSNYYFIRSDFFSERAPYYNTLFGFLKRVVSSYVFIVATAFVFQVLFLGPFTNLRGALFKRMSKKKVA